MAFPAIKKWNKKNSEFKANNWNKKTKEPKAPRRAW